MYLFSMKSAVQSFILFIFCIFLSCSAKNTNRVLLISFDGFRWDYIHRANNLTNFHRMISDGGWAVKGIKNTFLTKTLPNHYTIATGLYEESHGIVGNIMYDPVLNSTFHGWLDKDARDSRWWDNGGEPIWVTNQKQDTQHRSGVLAWPGGLAVVKGVLAYRTESAFDGLTKKERVDKIIEWFTDEYPINLGLYYEEEPDHTGHLFGPDSKEVLSMIFELDSLLGYFFDKLEDNDLLKTTNIILTSDHGMTSTPLDAEHKINLDDYVRVDSYSITSKNPVAGIDIIPASKELEDEVFKNLSRIPHAHVYRTKDIPRQYHYGNNRRIPMIIVEPEEHYWISFNGSAGVLGEHGYNNSLASMHPFFIAMGPDFKPGAKVDTFNNVDIYPLMCTLLGLKPAPNNGSLDVVSQLLIDREGSDSTTFGAYILILLLIALVGGLFSVAACQVHRQHKRQLRSISSFSLLHSFRYSKSDRMPLMSDSSEEEFGDS
ncbi:bis(5'-adenosyl)-triphosphatase enpp4-like [Mercenaria mercenaria]|uniref:bis(5'-adenosyl)-triphosphatase enpp4-like n=1 Tax=Mercenaria mercenaria TaxID=6596 RepID=UPI00234E3A60|nr:bis(5'-adenosyl)-triphosphatase enpp4-like [Mercenaria mercenaria]